MKHLQERPVTTQVCIGQHLGKISDRLMRMNAEKQGDGSGHRVLLERKLGHSLAPLLAAQAGVDQVKYITLHYVARKTDLAFPGRNAAFELFLQEARRIAPDSRATTPPPWLIA